MKFNKISCIVLIIFLAGCNKKDVFEMESSTNSIDTNFVTLDQAQKIAQFANLKPTQAKIVIKKLKGSKNSSLQNSKTIREYIAIKDATNTPEFYIFCYEEGGFSIISADLRTLPILAFSENSEFKIVDETSYPEGLQLC